MTAARRAQLREEGMCADACNRPSVPGKSHCPPCCARRAQEARTRYRIKHGLPMDKPINGWREPAGQCSRCSAPRAPGSELCDGHRRTFAELALERGNDEEEAR